MKKTIVIVLLIVLLAAAVFSALSTVSDNTKYANSGKTYMKYAEEQIELGGYGSAIDYINAAIKVEATPERYHRLAETYRLAENYKGYTEAMERLISLFPKEQSAYKELANYYNYTLDYESCVRTLKTASKQGVLDTEMADLYYKVAYRYNVVSASFFNAYRFYTDNALVQLDDGVCYINKKMQNKIGTFEKAAQASSSVLAVYVDNHWCYINESGTKYMESEKPLLNAWSFADNLALVQMQDGYYFLNNHGTVALGPYEEASCFYGGIAAVKKDGSWKLINKSGAAICEETFTDVLINEDHFCSCGGVVFASTGNGYDMYGSDGAKIAASAFEDADPFFIDDYAAVKKGGKWGFVDKTGKIIIEPSFSGAKSFGHGIGAVCNESGKWGFITSSGRVVIDYQYDDAKAFSSDGYAPVKDGSFWMYIKISG